MSGTKRMKDSDEIASTKVMSCTCTKSNCKKNYCDCFKAGIICGPSCRCIDCKNTLYFTKTQKPPRHTIEFVRVEVCSSKINVKEGKMLFTRFSDKKKKKCEIDENINEVGVGCIKAEHSNIASPASIKSLKVNKK